MWRTLMYTDNDSLTAQTIYNTLKVIKLKTFDEQNNL